MKLYNILLILIIFSLSFVINACRPPELEQAVIDYNGGRFDNAYEEVLIATEKYPDNEEAWYYLGELQGRKGQLKEMMESFDKSLALKDTYANEIALAKKNYFSKFYNDAVSAYNAMIKIEDKESPAAIEKIDLIIDNFGKVLTVQNDYMANRLVSVAYQFKNDDENRLKYLQAAADAQPDTVLAWIDLGYYYQGKKDFMKAAEQFKKGSEVDPTNSECIIRYAESLDLAEARDEAIVAYKEAFEKIPNEKAVPFNLGLLLFKQANTVEGDDAKKNVIMEDAVFYFKKANEIDPEIKEVYDLLGTLLIQLEKYSEAQDLLARGVQYFPDSSSV
jgi:tetratricopeptide (TPR) repeat protein